MSGTFDSETYREVQRDGLLDLFLGSLMVVFFLFEVGEVVGGIAEYLPLALFFALVGGFVLLRRGYTYPRTGEPSNATGRRLLVAVGFVVGLAITGFGLFLTGEYFEESMPLWTGASILAGALVAFGTAASVLGVRRLWAYAFVFGGPWFAWGLLDTAGLWDDPGPLLLIAVIAAFAMGITHLARFRRDHPSPPAVSA